jgi:hypothetical protein
MIWVKESSFCLPRSLALSDSLGASLLGDRAQLYRVSSSAYYDSERNTR